MSAPFETSRFVPVEFRPMRTIAPERLSSFFRFLEALQAKGGRSYGARVIRGGGETVVSQCVSWLETQQQGPLAYQTFSKSSRLHTDSADWGSSMTIHSTKHGDLDMIVLVGSTMEDQGILDDRCKAATDALIESSLLDAGLITVPDIALRTRLSKGDVVLLDHTQPHCTQTLSKSRLTDVYY